MTMMIMTFIPFRRRVRFPIHQQYHNRHIWNETKERNRSFMKESLQLAFGWTRMKRFVKLRAANIIYSSTHTDRHTQRERERGRQQRWILYNLNSHLETSNDDVARSKSWNERWALNKTIRWHSCAGWHICSSVNINSVTTNSTMKKWKKREEIVYMFVFVAVEMKLNSIWWVWMHWHSGTRFGMWTAYCIQTNQWRKWLVHTYCGTHFSA